MAGVILALATAAVAQETKRADGKTALNRRFHGQVVALKERTITLYYDFEHPDQLKDFEAARPMRYLDACENRARIEKGKLVLEGSTGLRHKLESRDAIHARFHVCPEKLRNVGAVITEPVLSEFYVVYNLFEHRFTDSGYMHIGAVGLHEDEGAEDMRSGLVNYRDVFARDLRKSIEEGEDLVVEVSKQRWKECFCCGKVKGKGSSKGKTKDMRDLKLGLFVHHSSARFDDLTLTCTLSDEYLDLEDLTVEIDANVDADLEAYEKRGHDARQVVSILSWPWLDKKVRRRAADALIERNDRAILPLLLEPLRSPDRAARKLAIEVVEAIAGDTCGYAPDGRELDRARAIAKLEKLGPK